MSAAVLSLPPGLGWSVKRSPLWKTRRQEAISGKRTTLTDWSFPRWQWELTIDFLRQAGANQQASSFAGAIYAEFATLAGFFNQRSGGFDSFLFQDPDDNTAPSKQTIATGDGVTTVFPIVRSFGGFVEPICAVNVPATLYYNGMAQPHGGSTFWDVVLWSGNTFFGSAPNPSPNPPGSLIIASAPPAGTVIGLDFTFYFPCQFDEDTLTFEKFMAALYSAKSVKFSSLK